MSRSGGTPADGWSTCCSVSSLSTATDHPSPQPLQIDKQSFPMQTQTAVRVPPPYALFVRSGARHGGLPAAILFARLHSRPAPHADIQKTSALAFRSAGTVPATHNRLHQYSEGRTVTQNPHDCTDLWSEEEHTAFYGRDIRASSGCCCSATTCVQTGSLGPVGCARSYGRQAPR